MIFGRIYMFTITLFLFVIWRRVSANNSLSDSWYIVTTASSFFCGPLLFVLLFLGLLLILLVLVLVLLPLLLLLLPSALWTGFDSAVVFSVLLLVLVEGEVIFLPVIGFLGDAGMGSFFIFVTLALIFVWFLIGFVLEVDWVLLDCLWTIERGFVGISFLGVLVVVPFVLWLFPLVVVELILCGPVLLLLLCLVGGFAADRCWLEIVLLLEEELYIFPLLPWPITGVRPIFLSWINKMIYNTIEILRTKCN